MKIEIEKYKTTDFDKFLIDLSAEIQEPQPLISLCGKPLFTRGNISCISGKAKSRKTFLIGLFSSQFLELEDEANVLIFDTEQAQFHTHKATKRIHQLLKWNDNENDEHLRVFKLRELDTGKRLEVVKNAIEYYQPDLVFIDGVRDLLRNFNDIVESSEVINVLMRLSSETNCHICTVLHENKNDNALRGHAGTELQNKCETVISVEIGGDTSKVFAKFCRNIPFDEFYFRINTDGLPEYCEPEIKPTKTNRLKSLFDGILQSGITLSYAELRSKVMEQSNIKEKTAEKKIKEASEQGIIAKNEIGRYYIAEQSE